MAGSSVRVESRERIAAEAEATRAATVANAPEMAADPSTAGQATLSFSEALGIETKSWWNPLSWTDDSKLGKTEVREVIGKMEPNQFLDAMAKTTDNPEAQKTIELIKENPEMAIALRDAIANDETMLSGMQEVLGADGASADLVALNTALVNDFQSGILTEVLTKIGDDSKDLGGDDINFSHLERLMDAQRIEDPAKRDAALQASLSDMSINPAAQIDFMQFISDFFENPERAINNLVNDLVDAGTIDPEMANMIKGVGASIGIPTAAALSPYADYVNKYDIGMETPGRIANAAATYGAEMSERHGASQAELDASSASMNEPGAAQAEALRTGQPPVETRVSFNPAATAESMIEDASTITQVAVTRQPVAFDI